eukprot:CAMPEP_0195014608 /NCGR_PEP_ID=MMETSP0326_2-20130528/16307_1 /TAXON_ID=2866 ORGANISM="Crypthecodinium cohnii, Strain Seligo" /NCGR_SAMPLE_ID=MMETSP0326_2 /ASSEMBLY_ACC=CAM_ASM_000348 /LENGTH=61 /DNA_ID=CAMNT_0040027575 /DNA_START=88 /DNA_END=270 /DNA_ORIENTATION=-
MTAAVTAVAVETISANSLGMMAFRVARAFSSVAAGHARLHTWQVRVALHYSRSRPDQDLTE